MRRMCTRCFAHRHLPLLRWPHHTLPCLRSNAVNMFPASITHCRGSIRGHHRLCCRSCCSWASLSGIALGLSRQRQATAIHSLACGCVWLTALYASVPGPPLQAAAVGTAVATIALSRPLAGAAAPPSQRQAGTRSAQADCTAPEQCCRGPSAAAAMLARSPAARRVAPETARLDERSMSGRGWVQGRAPLAVALQPGPAASLRRPESRPQKHIPSRTSRLPWRPPKRQQLKAASQSPYGLCGPLPSLSPVALQSAPVLQARPALAAGSPGCHWMAPCCTSPALRPPLHPRHLTGSSSLTRGRLPAPGNGGLDAVSALLPRPRPRPRPRPLPWPRPPRFLPLPLPELGRPAIPLALVAGSDASSSVKAAASSSTSSL
ncbi:hypothetical protein COCSUDRAFT_45588 [Coccomyxa subellipsoidea C-169]|uniref:Uncharacterized protein n=1 Tax=Coccomyxa subellipsoidea (strain C-169) TaxID=574566 RepID=I0YIF7_COCSC|nr:hypothetical protein COCSUDRAFT_45588 [Coccomyxa subellipsoidea C-169]EIE18176.1 hypothetical protein COCSUDRAFT_45588 [Coccomyxa subellipsoidea C-169]|eukprot:XP_005642720.1 hypothetical protein COCSUDRAFT_45588 [Coccomyxa subellipsoidea C-169]